MMFMRMLTAAMLAIFATTSVNAVTLVVSGGKLLGATGVTVDGGTYGVSFVDGTCAGVYGSCTHAAFDFSTAARAQLAGQALLDQVLLDGPHGNFDTNPGLTFGCTSNCNTHIAYSVSGTAVSGSTVFNIIAKAARC